MTKSLEISTLETLVASKFRWCEIHTKFGLANDVPSRIAQLFRGNSTERAHAYWKLDNVIVLQGSLSQAAYYTASVILEVLSTGEERINLQVANLLFEILNGHAERDEDIILIDGIAKPLSNICYSIISSNWKLIFDRYIDATDDLAASTLADMLISMPDQYHNIRNELVAVKVGSERNAKAIALILKIDSEMRVSKKEP